MTNRMILPLLLGILAATGCRTSSGMTSGAPAESVVTAPQLDNPEEMAEAIAREYPEQLRRDGVSGTTRLRLLVGSDGVPEEVRMLESSGYRDFDAAALRVGRTLRFSPATNDQGRAVGVWVSFPIRFRAP